jgi:hypothetical protein
LKGREKTEHSKRGEGMEERRRTSRMKDENEVTITDISGENNFPKERIIDDRFEDISVYGAKIKTNMLLPVDTLLELDFKSKGVLQQINLLVKIKWTKVVVENESYEMGVEFYPSKAIEKLEDYISWKIKSNKSESIEKKLPPIDSGDINIEQTNKLPPIDFGDINIEQTKKLSAMDSGYINIEQTNKLPPINSGDKNIEQTNKLPPIKNKQWIGIAIILLGTIILIVVLLTNFGYIPELDRMLFPNIITKVKPVPEIKAIPAPVAKATPVPEAKATPVPEVKATPAPEAKTTPAPVAKAIPVPVVKAIPAPVAKATPAPAAKQKTKVIGNSDSKKYHLPGMKYYNAVKAYHRVEFDSEADAIKAGYNKAPQ